MTEGVYLRHSHVATHQCRRLTHDEPSFVQMGFYRHAGYYVMAPGTGCLDWKAMSAENNTSTPRPGFGSHLGSRLHCSAPQQKLDPPPCSQTHMKTYSVSARGKAEVVRWCVATGALPLAFSTSTSSHNLHLAPLKLNMCHGRKKMAAG